MERIEFEDWLSDTITDSIDMDWSSRMAAQLITDRMEEQGVLAAVLEAVEKL